jgi:hypothetical protein
VFFKAYLMENVSVSVSGGQMQRRVVAPVGDIHPGTTLDQQLHQFGVALLGSPVQGTEAVVIAKQISGSLSILAEAFSKIRW